MMLTLAVQGRPSRLNLGHTSFPSSAYLGSVIGTRPNEDVSSQRADISDRKKTPRMRRSHHANAHVLAAEDQSSPSNSFRLGYPPTTS